MRKSLMCIMLLSALALVFFGCSSDSKTLKFSPKSLMYGEVNLGDKVSKDIIVTNGFGKQITLQTLNIDGASDFYISNAIVVPKVMEKGDEFTVSITFEPNTGGILEAMLLATIENETKELEVLLTGTGIPVARIEITPMTFDYQKKLINKPHSKDFEIKNIGTALLEVSNLSFIGTGSSAYSISAGGLPIQILPAQTHNITVDFSTALVGTYDAELQISHNAVNGDNPAVINLTAEAIDIDPRITLNITSTWDFGNIATSMPKTQICEIENTGIDPLTVAKATLTNASEFQILSIKDAADVAITLPHQVAIGAKIFLEIEFAPTGAGNFSDTLAIEHDGTNENTPLNITLSGEGHQEMSKTFTFTGAEEQWTVPAGVTSIVVECKGAEGGNGYKASSGHIPGKGGMAKATVTVTPGSTIYVYVGGRGGNASSGTGGTGGYNGGANGYGYSSYGGGGGGGASDVRVGGNTLSDRKVVGAGGGGAAYNYSTGDNGGDGGDLVGQHGAGNSNYSDPHAGSGGTQTAGGLEGKYPPNYGDAYPGTFGAGGAGGNGSGGGGGAGWYGGGGGVWAGGGGGSSYHDASGNTNPSTTGGVQTGDGVVTFTY